MWHWQAKKHTKTPGRILNWMFCNFLFLLLSFLLLAHFKENILRLNFFFFFAFLQLFSRDLKSFHHWKSFKSRRKMPACKISFASWGFLFAKISMRALCSNCASFERFKVIQDPIQIENSQKVQIFDFSSPSTVIRC